MFMLPSVRGRHRQDGKLMIDFFVYAAIVVWVMSGLAKPGARPLISGGVVLVGLEAWSVVHAGAKRELSENIFNISKVPPEVLGKTPLDTPNHTFSCTTASPSLTRSRRSGSTPARTADAVIAQ